MNIRLTPQAIAAARVMRGQGKPWPVIARLLAVQESTIRNAVAGRTHKAWAEAIGDIMKRGEK